MLKFKVSSDFKLDIEWKMIVFEPFNNIVKADKKDRLRKRAKQLLLYIYLREDISNENPFGKMQYEDRKTEAERTVFGKIGAMKLSKSETEMVGIAIDTYVKYSSTSEERMLSTIDEAIDKQNEVLISLKIDDVNFTKKSKAVSDNITTFLKQKKTLVDIIKGNVSGKVRADQSSSLIESGSFRNIKSITGK